MDKRLSNEFISEIKEYHRGGRSVGEIMLLMKEKHTVDISASAIYYHIREKKKGKKRGTKDGKFLGGTDDLVSDIIKLIEETRAGYREMLLKIRKELIESRAQVLGIKDVDMVDKEN